MSSTTIISLHDTQQRALSFLDGETCSAPYYDPTSVCSLCPFPFKPGQLCRRNRSYQYAHQDCIDRFNPRPIPVDEPVRAILFNRPKETPMTIAAIAPAPSGYVDMMNASRQIGIDYFKFRKAILAGKHPEIQKTMANGKPGIDMSKVDAHLKTALQLLYPFTKKQKEASAVSTGRSSCSAPNVQAPATKLPAVPTHVDVRALKPLVEQASKAFQALLAALG